MWLFYILIFQQNITIEVQTALTAGGVVASVVGNFFAMKLALVKLRADVDTLKDDKEDLDERLKFIERMPNTRPN
jgi:hypothetical protein